MLVHQSKIRIGAAACFVEQSISVSRKLHDLQNRVYSNVIEMAVAYSQDATEFFKNGKHPKRIDVRQVEKLREQVSKDFWNPSNFRSFWIAQEIGNALKALCVGVKYSLQGSHKRALEQTREAVRGALQVTFETDDGAVDSAFDAITADYVSSLEPRKQPYLKSIVAKDILPVRKEIAAEQAVARKLRQVYRARIAKLERQVAALRQTIGANRITARIMQERNAYFGYLSEASSTCVGSIVAPPLKLPDTAATVSRIGKLCDDSEALQREQLLLSVEQELEFKRRELAELQP